MASSTLPNNEVNEGLTNIEFWKAFDFHLKSYVKSPIQLRYLSCKTLSIGQALRQAIVDLLDHTTQKLNGYIDDNTSEMGTEHRLYYSRHFVVQGSELPDAVQSNEIDFEISSLAPTIFHQLRENIGITNEAFRHSFSAQHLKDFTNPGKSGSLMYKTSDDLYILKTLREYEARFLMQILSGYHLQLTQRSTLFTRYVGLYSLRFPALISSIEIYIVVMVNAFTSTLELNEIFDLKGSTMKRISPGNLSKDKLHQLKDLDFLSLYPHGIRIPSHIYQRLHMILCNDVKTLKKLNITDFSLILGVKYVDVSEDELMLYRPTTGVSALFHLTHNFILRQVNSNQRRPLVSYPLTKPLTMLGEKLDSNFFYYNNTIAERTLPIPGIVNRSDQRVYLYCTMIDMLQTYDSVKYIEQTLKKIIDPNRHMQYSVIEPDKYEKRFLDFVFEKLFTDAKDDFIWAGSDLRRSANESQDSRGVIGFRL